MAPKKHNAFMSFVQEWRKNNAEGRQMSLPQAVAHCGDLWKNMNAQQRGPYKSNAKNADVAARAKVEPMNSYGQAISAVEREERERAEHQMKMKRSIERMVINGRKQHDLENTKFVFAAFNYFARTNSTGIYIPAEFAACLFSLQSGITSVYSTLINPGHILFGQSCESQQHAETTHQLPLPPAALGESDIVKLYSNILEYLRSCEISEDSKEPLVVFTTPELMPVVKGCFRYLDCDVEEEILVYDIQYLFYILKKEVMEIADLPHDQINKSVTDTLFAKDFFEYYSGISCQYHEDNDRSKYCTQSMVSRWSYLFSDYMCGDLAIKPLLGRHMPPKQECNFRVVNTLEESRKNISYGSMSSFHTAIKEESQTKYVPADHTAYTASLDKADDFPSLGGRKPKNNRRVFCNNHFDPVQKNNWDVPTTKPNAKDVDDAFNMPRR